MSDGFTSSKIMMTWQVTTKMYSTLLRIPTLVLRGYRDSLVAVRSYGRQRYLMVIYRQVSGDDGFIITAYFTRKIDRRKAVWRKP
jgi:hypothetical protein